MYKGLEMQHISSPLDDVAAAISCHRFDALVAVCK